MASTKVLAGIAVGSAVLLAILFGLAERPRVVRVIHDEDGYTETFYNTPCTDENVLAIGKLFGVPTEKMRAGKVEKGGESRDFCYRDNPGGVSTFILDDHGNMGNLQIPK